MKFHRDEFGISGCYDIRVGGTRVGTIWDTERAGSEFRWKMKFWGQEWAAGFSTYRDARHAAITRYRVGGNHSS